MMRRISFHTLGCKVNFAESSTLARMFAEAGFTRVGPNSEADIYVINSCSVTAHADKKCRNLINKLHRRSPGAVIAVTGCYAQLNPEPIAAMEGVDFVFGNNFKEIIAEVITNYELRSDAASESRGLINSDYAEPRGGKDCAAGLITNGDPRVGKDREAGLITDSLPSVLTDGQQGSKTITGFSPIHCSYDNIDAFFPAWSGGDRTRAFLKVQDGCDYKCSYCTIHYARGKSRNISIGKAVEQAREIAAQGIKEIVLTGINTGDFGRTTGERFIDLLRELDSVDGIERYRISSIEPNLLSDEIIEFCAASRKFQPHYHIPLQSGSDRILGLMRRRYTTAKFADRVRKVRSLAPGTFFGVDVIVGFPGETDEDFETTYRFLEELAPSYLHVFPFSERPGTPAVDLPGKVSPKTAAERAAKLGGLSDRLYREFAAKYTGTRAKVLFEGSRKDGMMYGFTENYIKVRAPYNQQLVNELTEITLGEWNGNDGSLSAAGKD